MNVNFLSNVTPRNFSNFKFDERVIVIFLIDRNVQILFVFGDSEIVCVSQMSNFPDALLQLTHIFGSRSDAEVNVEVMLNSKSETFCDTVYFLY